MEAAANGGAAPVAWTYRALDGEGQQRRGTLQAGSETEALRELLSRGLTPLELAAAGAPSGAATPARPFGARSQASAADRATLVQEMATLLAAGISLAEALPSLAQSYAAHPLGAPLARLDREVRGGGRFSEALRRSGLGLPDYVHALAQAGEAGGDLAGALRDAAAQLEHERRIAQELRTALVYPTVLVVAGVLAVGVIFVGVVPRFAGLLKSSRADVPAVSRWVIESGVFVSQHLGAFALGAAALAACLAAALLQPGWRAALLDRLTRVPVLGPWLLRVELGRWTTVLSRLLANRVPIIDALELSAGALRLAGLRADLAGLPREIERGRMLSDTLAGLRWFPATRLNLVRVGERAGELPRMLATLGAMETEAARTLQQRALSLIEPAAILLIGAAIGFVMVAVMMAITSLNTVVG